MSLCVGNFGQVSVVLTYILTLQSVMANFGYNDVFEDELELIQKRQLVGGQTEIPQNKLDNYADLLAGIDKAAENLNEDLAFVKSSRQVTSQIVQGILYRVKVDARPKSCSRSESCNVVKHCSFKIWSREWLLEDEKLQIKDFACTDV